MRALMVHVNTFLSQVVETSTRPYNIQPEGLGTGQTEMRDCLAVFFCVEKNDTTRHCEQMFCEIVRAVNDMQTRRLLLSPFVHLSRNIAGSQQAKNIYAQLCTLCREAGFEIATSHFGYHKTLLLDCKGHPGSFRYREFS